MSHVTQDEWVVSHRWMSRVTCINESCRTYKWVMSHIGLLQMPRGCSVLQCVAVWHSVAQRVAVCCSVILCVAVCCSVSQRVAVCCSLIMCVAVFAVCCSVCSVLQCVADERVLWHIWKSKETHTHAHARMNTHTHIHTKTDTHIHAHTQTHLCVRIYNASLYMQR